MTLRQRFNPAAAIPGRSLGPGRHRRRPTTSPADGGRPPPAVAVRRRLDAGQHRGADGRGRHIRDLAPDSGLARTAGVVARLRRDPPGVPWSPGEVYPMYHVFGGPRRSAPGSHRSAAGVSRDRDVVALGDAIDADRDCSSRTSPPRAVASPHRRAAAGHGRVAILDETTPIGTTGGALDGRDPASGTRRGRHVSRSSSLPFAYVTAWTSRPRRVRRGRCPAPGGACPRTACLEVRVTEPCLAHEREQVRLDVVVAPAAVLVEPRLHADVIAHEHVVAPTGIEDAP